MKKYLILILIVLVIVTLFVGVQVVSGKVTKLTGKDAVAMIPAADMSPRYNLNIHFPEAKGKVNMIQPNGNVDVILGVSVDGLAANSRYIVYFDKTGITPGVDSTMGSWEEVGDFWTDDLGHGEWNYTAPAGLLDLGEHEWSVFINRIAAGQKTVLISYNVEFIIEE